MAYRCPSCGAYSIHTNQSCSLCRMMREGIEAQERASGQSVKTYIGDEAREIGIAAMAIAGWELVSETTYQPRQPRAPIHYTIIFKHD